MKKILAVFMLLAMLSPYAFADASFDICNFNGLQYAVPSDWIISKDSDELRSHYSLSGENVIVLSMGDLAMITDESRELYADALISGIFEIEIAFDFQRYEADGSYRSSYIGTYPSVSGNGLEPVMLQIVCTSKELYIFAYMPISITGDTVAKFEDLCTHILLADAVDSTAAVPAQNTTYTTYEKNGLRFYLPSSWTEEFSGDTKAIFQSNRYISDSGYTLSDVYFSAHEGLDIPDARSKERAAKNAIYRSLTNEAVREDLNLAYCEQDGSYRSLVVLETESAFWAVLIVCSDSSVYLLDRSFGNEPTDEDIAQMEEILDRMEVIG